MLLQEQCRRVREEKEKNIETLKQETANKGSTEMKG